MSSGMIDGAIRSAPTAAAWSPQPGPQTEAITADWCDELFYGGAAGGGKSDLLLGDYLQDVPTYGMAWQGVLFRRTYGELEELVARSREIYPQTGAEWLEQKHRWVWPNGASLRLRYLERDADATRYQGHQYVWIGWDELTQWATPYAYRFLRARLRSPHKVATKRIRSAANPGGVGHLWVKDYFVDPAPGGYEPMLDATTGMRRMFVPARLTDNAILLANDPNYAGRLRGLGSATLVKAWLDGDWSVIEGAFFDCWSNEKHVVAPFTIPDNWTRFRSGDWGSASPFSIGWWAVVQDDWQLDAAGIGNASPAHTRSDRAEQGHAGLDESGTRRTLPRGALVRYREWYGSTGAPNVGLKMTAEQVADGITLREAGDPKLSYGVLDPSAFKQDGGPSIAERINMRLIAAKCAAFRPADNARVAQRGAMGGWDQMRNRLIGKEDRPMIYTFSTCANSIRTIPALQHDQTKPEDVDTEMEDHAGDEWRYACMSRPYMRTVASDDKAKNKTGYKSFERSSDSFKAY